MIRQPGVRSGSSVELRLRMSIGRCAARQRFDEGVWRKATVRHRRDVLRGIADLIRRDRERLAALESSNAGKPITAARGEIGAVATTSTSMPGRSTSSTARPFPGTPTGL